MIRAPWMDRIEFRLGLFALWLCYHHYREDPPLGARPDFYASLSFANREGVRWQRGISVPAFWRRK